MSIDNVRYLTFDVFGTVVDWRSSVIGEVERVASAKRIDIDATAFVDAWKSCYRPGMDAVNRGDVDWTNVDAISRRKLDTLLSDYGLDALSEQERDHLNRAWTRLNPWPDAVAGLRNPRRP